MLKVRFYSGLARGVVTLEYGSIEHAMASLRYDGVRRFEHMEADGTRNAYTLRPDGHWNLDRFPAPEPPTAGVPWRPSQQDDWNDRSEE